MGDPLLNRFSGSVTVFHDLHLPEPGWPAGYAALIDAYGLDVPLPHRLTAIGERHKVLTAGDWRLLTPRHRPKDTLAAHLTFALKWEGVDLLVLNRLFLAVGDDAITAIVRSQPTGSYARRIWFLYEWLTDRTLHIPDAKRGSFTDVLDPETPVRRSGRSLFASPRPQQSSRNASVLPPGLSYRGHWTLYLAARPRRPRATGHRARPR